MNISDLVLSVDSAMVSETGTRAELLAMSKDMFAQLSTAFPAIKEQYDKDQSLAGRPLVLDNEIPTGQILGYNKSKGLEKYLRLRRLKRVLKDKRRARRK